MTAHIDGKPPHRGDKITITFTLDGEWVFEDFDELFMTVRDGLPASTVVDDSAALGKVAVTGTGTACQAVFPAATTQSWPAGKLNWDVQGKVGSDVHTLESGLLTLIGDVTRA